MRFEEIPGLLALKETLVLSHQRNHLAHAQLFSGQEGGAALPLAIAYATYLLCENKECDRCLWKLSDMSKNGQAHTS